MHSRQSTADTLVVEPVELVYTPIKQLNEIWQSKRDAFASGLTIPLAYRKQQLRNLYKFLDSEQNGICDALALDLGKPTTETMFCEIGGVKMNIVDCLNHIDEWAEAEKEALGTVLIIGTWNYPLNLTLGPLVYAIAGGNTAVLKWNEVCVHTSKFIAENLNKYVDPQVVSSVQGAVDETTALLELRWDLIFYTGNSKVAKIIQQAASKNLTPTILELGGKSPAIVDFDINVSVAAKRIIWAKFFNVGQTCVAPDYVLVDKRVAKQLVSAMKDSLKELFGKDIVQSIGYGKISCDRHFGRLQKMLTEQLKVEGTVAETTVEYDEARRYMSPVILTGLSADPDVNPIMKEEIFGPILPVIEVEDLDEAIDLVNSRPSPLAFYPFSKSSVFIERVFAEVSGGNAMANDAIVSLLVDDLPFGGVGDSGMGSYHGKHGFDSFTRKRATMIRTLTHDLFNTPRYQNVSYENGSFMSKALIWLFNPALPNASWLAAKDYWRRNRSLFLFCTYALTLYIVFDAGVRSVQ